MFGSGDIFPYCSIHIYISVHLNWNLPIIQVERFGSVLSRLNISGSGDVVCRRFESQTTRMEQGQLYPVIQPSSCISSPPLHEQPVAGLICYCLQLQLVLRLLLQLATFRNRLLALYMK